MGLAATQARFLGITARKSNIEYEGQQVNQQRTALAEEVNSLYSKLLQVKVPIAPDVTDFYESDYSFEVTNSDGYDGKYIVKSYYANADGETYYLNTERTYNKNVAVGVQHSRSRLTLSGTQYSYTDDKGNTHPLTANAGNSDAMVTLINNTYGTGTVADDEKFYYYKDDDSGMTYYIPASQVTATQGAFSIYNSANKEITENIGFDAKINFDENNRMREIYTIKTASMDEPVNVNTEVNTTRVYDSEGYQQALRDYTMSKDEYDKEIADLNAQTESLQQEDKVLELRLNQIDTEQKALQTELDAVKSVLDKNIEKTFNTFSA